MSPTPAELMADIIALITPVINLITQTVVPALVTLISTNAYFMFTVGFLVVGACIKVVRSLLRR